MDSRLAGVVGQPLKGHMEKKLGVYLCLSCGIGESLDIEKLSQIPFTEYSVPICKTLAVLCSEKGLKLIREDIEHEGLNTIVIAACSPRVNHDIFSFPPSIIIERVNLREHVTWSHLPKDEDTQMLGEDYLRMGIAKAKNIEPPEPLIQNIEKAILVIGGGIAGITASIEGAKAGYKVVLVEKNPTLGGWMTKLYKQFPKHPPYKDLEEPGIEARIKEVEHHPNIKIFTSADIEKISGGPGMFEVNIKQNGGACPEQSPRNGGDIVTEKVGSIVLATGWKPYDATKLNRLGFGKYPNVITSIMMEEMASKGRIARPSDGEDVKSVAYIQCAGSRDENHLPYCSAVCCLTALKQAKYIREKNRDSRVFIFYKDIRTPGQYENFYKSIQEDEGIFLSKGDVYDIKEDEEKNLLVELENTMLGDKIWIKTDLVVLPIGIVPTTLDSEILNLDYRLGKELPVLKYGFPDSHFICFPYETQRTGIYAAGCVRQPMDSTSSMEDGAGAVLKAIQCIELTARGAAVHPRAGDLTYPDLFLQRCTQCKRCTEECPFGTYNEDEKYTPLLNPTRCRRCGICLGSCPERIINFKDYSINIISSMIKAINVPEDEEKLRILSFMCENDAYPSLDIAGIRRITYDPNIRVIPVRCLGAINVVWIADALAKGMDGILLVGCKYGDDYQCHFIKGSELAEYRMEKVQETLQRLVLESKRVRVIQFSISDYNKIPGIFDEFIEDIKEIGPNPFKGL